jgi:hypothetical protein
MPNLHYEHQHVDVACNLDAAEMGTRAAEWRRLRESLGLGADPVPGGARLWLRPDAWETASDLARREADCCGFLDFDLVSDGDRIHLDIRSPAPEALGVVACLAGLEDDCVLKCC